MDCNGDWVDAISEQYRRSLWSRVRAAHSQLLYILNLGTAYIKMGCQFSPRI